MCTMSHLCPQKETRDWSCRGGLTHSPPRGFHDARGTLDNCQLIVVSLDAVVIGFSFNQLRLFWQKETVNAKTYNTSPHPLQTYDFCGLQNAPHSKKRDADWTKNMKKACRIHFLPCSPFNGFRIDVTADIPATYTTYPLGSWCVIVWVYEHNPLAPIFWYSPPVATTSYFFPS